jgi:hypothetical protein
MTVLNIPPVSRGPRPPRQSPSFGPQRPGLACGSRRTTNPVRCCSSRHRRRSGPAVIVDMTRCVAETPRRPCPSFRHGRAPSCSAADRWRCCFITSCAGDRTDDCFPRPAFAPLLGPGCPHLRPVASERAGWRSRAVTQRASARLDDAVTGPTLDAPQRGAPGRWRTACDPVGPLSARAAAAIAGSRASGDPTPSATRAPPSPLDRQACGRYPTFSCGVRDGSEPRTGSCPSNPPGTRPVTTAVGLPIVAKPLHRWWLRRQSDWVSASWSGRRLALWTRNRKPDG